MAEGSTGRTCQVPAQMAASAPVAADVDVEDEPLPELPVLPEPVGMFGQWWPDEVVELLPDVPLDVPLDVPPALDEEPVEPDVDVEVLAVVVAWLPEDVCAELAPAASIPRPRLNPAAPATAATAATGCLSFMTLPSFFHWGVGGLPERAVRPTTTVKAGGIRPRLGPALSRLRKR